MKQHFSFCTRLCSGLAILFLLLAFVMQLYANGSTTASTKTNKTWQSPKKKSRDQTYVKKHSPQRKNQSIELNSSQRALNPSLDQGGENCADAVVLPSVVPQTITGYTSGYLNDYGVGGLGSEPECWVGFYSETGSCAGPDVVYVFTAPATHDYSISLCGSGYDTGLLIYDYTCPTEPVNPGDFICGCDDVCGLASIISDLPLTSGQSILIVVDGYGSSSGNYALEITESPEENCQDICVDAAPLSFDTPTLVNTCIGCELYTESFENGCSGTSYESGPQVFFSIEIVEQGVYCIDVVGDPADVQGTEDVQFLLFTDCSDPLGSCVCSQDQNCPPETEITGPTHTEHACCELLPGTYFLGVSAYEIVDGACGELTVTLTHEGDCINLADKLELRATEDILLGPVFIGTSSSDSVFILNTSEFELVLYVGTDRPAAVTTNPSPGLALSPGDSAYIPLDFTALEPGWVDVSLMLSTDPTFTICDPLYIPMSIEGLPPLNTPGAPVLTPGIGFGRVHLQVHVNNNPVYTLYSVAVSLDGWATTQYLQTDGTLGSAPMWAEDGGWNTIISDDIAGIPPFTTLEVKAAASRLDEVTGYGPASSYYFPDPEPFIASPEELTATRQGNDLVLRWSPPDEIFGVEPIVDAKYRVEYTDSLGKPFSLVEETFDTTMTIVDEMLNGELKFYQVLLVSELGPLQPSLRLTIPAPGEVVIGDYFVITAVDYGSGAFMDGVSAEFQANTGAGWIPITEAEAPHWLEGRGIYSSMVNATTFPSGPCSLRVVETGPFGVAISAHEAYINRSPEAAIQVTNGDGEVTLDAYSSSEPDGSIESYCWTLPDNNHLYGPQINIPIGPFDTLLVSLEINDDYGTTGEVSQGIVVEEDTTIRLVHGIRCGCKNMKIKGRGNNASKGLYFPIGKGRLPDEKDSTRLGGLQKKIADIATTYATYRYQVHAEIIAMPDDEDELCIHYQEYQLDEKCNGIRNNHGDPQIGGANWRRDSVYSASTDSPILRHESGAKPHISWLSAASRAIHAADYSVCGPNGFSYEKLICDVVDGPLGCCRCKFLLKWIVGPDGNFIQRPTYVFSGAGLGCMNSSQGNCDCTDP